MRRLVKTELLFEIFDEFRVEALRAAISAFDAAAGLSGLRGTCVPRRRRRCGR